MASADGGIGLLAAQGLGGSTLVKYSDQDGGGYGIKYGHVATTPS